MIIQFLHQYNSYLEFVLQFQTESRVSLFSFIGCICIIILYKVFSILRQNRSHVKPWKILVYKIINTQVRTCVIESNTFLNLFIKLYYIHTLIIDELCAKIFLTPFILLSLGKYFSYTFYSSLLENDRKELLY